MTLAQYETRIDSLSHAASRILCAILHGNKLLSQTPKAQDRLAEIYTERDAVVREYQKIYKAKIQKEKEENGGEK